LIRALLPGEVLEQRLEGEADAAHALLAPGLGSERIGILERARRRAEALALWDSSPFPSAVFHGDGHVPSRVNAAWRQLFDGVPIPAAAIEAIDEVVQSSTARHLRELTVESSEHPRYCAAVLRPLRGILGATEGVIMVCAVTTDAVVATQLGVDTDALVWSAMTQGGGSWYNERWRAYRGVVDGDAWQQAIHLEDLPRCVHALSEASRLRTSTEIQARIRQAGKSYRWHRVRFSTSDSGTRWFGCGIDNHDEHTAQDERAELISHAVAARSDAEQANRLKDQFLAAVSHELRAPMTTMMLWVKILRDETSDTALKAQALDAINDSALAQSRLVGDLLDVSRGISGKLFVDLRTVDLSRICKDALAAIAPLAAARGISLIEDGTGTSVDAHGDEVRLRQVFGNLLSNAVKFTDAGGTVTLALQRKGRRVAVEITDTGHGIAPDFLPSMFQAFSQTEDALTRERGGLGLGLTIVKQLVELHHGTVTGTSAGRGRGSTFTVVLPAAGANRSHSPPVGVAQMPTLAGVRVLVVDDDPRVRDALALLLERTGASVDAAASPEEARSSISARPPSVIVCDIAMPGEDGYSFIRGLRGAGSELPAIALTAHAMEADAARALAAGFDRHLAKPIDFDVLVASVHDVLARPRRFA
jgi:signal transduction histidine kinase